MEFSRITGSSWVFKEFEEPLNLYCQYQVYLKISRGCANPERHRACRPKKCWTSTSLQTFTMRARRLYVTRCSQPKTLNLKGQKCDRGKNSKRRVTVLLCANRNSTDKRPLLVIGISKKPCCFKRNHRLPMQYTANLKSWMTRAIFNAWLQSFDADMRKAGGLVCLLLDNCVARHVDAEPGNVRLFFFPTEQHFPAAATRSGCNTQRNVRLFL